MLQELFGGENSVYWIVAGIIAVGIIGIKLVMINFDRRNRDKR